MTYSNARNKILRVLRSQDKVTIEDLVENFEGDSVSLGRALYMLKSKGQIVVEDPFVPGEVSSFIFSLYNLRFWVVTVLVIATVLSIYILPQSLPLLEVRFILGSLFVIYLPGYSLVEAWFASKELDQIERLGLSIGLSLAMVALVGLFLNYSPWGLTLTALVSSLALLTILLAVAASIERLGNLRRIGKSSSVSN